MRTSLRLFGVLVFGAALAILARDLVDRGGDSMYGLSSLRHVWRELDASSLDAVQGFVQRNLMAELWDPALVTALSWPASFVVGGTAILLILVAWQR